MKHLINKLNDLGEYCHASSVQKICGFGKQLWAMTGEEFESYGRPFIYEAKSKGHAKELKLKGFKLLNTTTRNKTIVHVWPKSAFLFPIDSYKNDSEYCVEVKLLPQAKVLEQDSFYFKFLSEKLKKEDSVNASVISKEAKGMGFDIVAFTDKEIGWVALNHKIIESRSHKMIIRQALQKSLPVPKKVIAEYQDLYNVYRLQTGDK